MRNVYMHSIGSNKPHVDGEMPMRNLVKLLGISILIAQLGAESALAGSSQTVLKCKSPDGSLSITGEVPPDGDDEIDVVIVNKKMSFRMLSTNEKQTRNVHAISDLPAGVYTLEAGPQREANSPDASFTLYALPKTVVTRKIQNGIESSWTGRLFLTGSAVIAEYEPRRFVNCTTRYQV